MGSHTSGHMMTSPSDTEGIFIGQDGDRSSASRSRIFMVGFTFSINVEISNNTKS